MLLETLREKRPEILEIAAKHGAFNIRVFGSVARGEETPQSDIDFLIDYDLEKITPWFPGGLLMDLPKNSGSKAPSCLAELQGATRAFPCALRRRGVARLTAARGLGAYRTALCYN